MEVKLGPRAALCAAALLTTLPAPAQEVLGEGPVTAVVLDRSGSMGGGMEWLASLLTQVDRDLGHTDSRPARYGLLEFLVAPQLVQFDGRMLGNIEALASQVSGLRTGGGEEDGYRALERALERYAALRPAALSLLLVTNEDRDALDASLDRDTLAAELARAGVLLDALVAVRFRCADGREALGMMAGGTGFVRSMTGVERCAGVQAEGTVPAGHTSVADYVDLALGSGGTAWNLYEARGPAYHVEPFARAFAAALRESGRTLVDTRPFVAQARAAPGAPQVGEVVVLDGSASFHRAAERAIYAHAWDVDGDGVFELNGPVVATRFAKAGPQRVTLRVSDDAYPEVVVETRLLVDVRP